MNFKRRVANLQRRQDWYDQNIGADGIPKRGGRNASSGSTKYHRPGSQNSK